MKHYLKTTKFGVEVCMYDEEKLTHTRVYLAKECEINDNFNDVYDLRDSLNRDVKDGYSYISEYEFYKELDKFKTELEIITKK